AFAINHPGVARSRVRGLVLLSTFARTPAASFSPIPAEKVASWLDLASLMRRPQLGTVLARIAFGKEPLGSHVELTRKMLAECDPDTARLAILPLLDVDLTGQLGAIDRPTLVIGGRSDVLTPPMESRRIAKHLPDARLVLVEHAGHMLMLERTELLHELLLDFARDVGVLDDVGTATSTAEQGGAE